MTETNIKKATIPLTDEQRELIRKNLGVNIAEWEVDLSLPGSGLGHVGALPDQPRGRAVFLTDDQRELIKRETGRECDFIEIENRPLLKYGGPPPRDR